MVIRNTAALAVVSLCATPLWAGEVATYHFASETLGRDYVYSIYLPDGYHDSQMQYPHLYLLHGNGGNERTWVTDGNAASILDQEIGAGTIPPAVVIMPSSPSWWVDGYNEPAETAFFDDLIPHVEATWRVIPERAGRAVAGLSAGGFGTVNFALEHPEMFAAAAALSPASYVPVPPSHSSGNRSASFVGPDGAFDPDKWAELNYTAYIDDYLAQDVVVPMYINSGDHDTFDIAYHGAVLYQKLREHQPQQVEFRVVDGDHEWKVWQETLPEALDFVFSHTALPRGAMPAPVPD